MIEYHPSLIGLTGTDEQLAVAYQSDKQKPVSVGNDWDNDPVISHSSYIYLMDQAGNLATLFPLILSPQSMADIIRKHVNSAS